MTFTDMKCAHQGCGHRLTWAGGYVCEGAVQYCMRHSTAEKRAAAEALAEDLRERVAAAAAFDRLEREIVEKFFYGTICREYQNDDSTFHTLPDLTPEEFERYMIKFIERFSKEYSRSQVNDHIFNHINHWQHLYDLLRKTENKEEQSLEKFL